ncbi:GATA-type transcription factor sreA [Psilocybe cubensis]|nr:GATA-type transcription factor sreA [Psilocybe cubensis]KAH9482310.1 GATA-type transcription factor sreA [Psilocybe cubensis]
MDSLSFDGYTTYSDASTPRTPSPTDMHFAPDFKHDIDHPVQNIFAPTDDDNAGAVVVPPSSGPYWSQNSSTNTHPYAFNNTSNNSSRGSLLQELYESDIPEQSLSPNFSHQSDNWSQQQQQQQQQRPSEFSMMRRATFPYVRRDHEDAMPMQYVQQQQQQMQMMHLQQMQHGNGMQYSRGEHLYNEPHHMDSAHDFIPSMSNSPHSSYRDFDDGANIKLEEGAPLMVPSQTSFYRPNSSGGVCGSMSLSYLSPHTGLPVQHTDDAASKETQYLRRRCFNCHTTEPPSWRRSTLNPGKIVCNKCGLYERTHLRPRPLRFDELRAGNKARKQSKATTGPNPSVSPKQSKMVKKEPREYGTGALLRRSSVSSSSSVHSGSGASDWDDNVSIYSSGSAPPTSFNSPIQQSYPLSRSDSQSPPRDGGIRLPNNPLSDIASMNVSHGPQSQLPTPRKSHTSPGAYFAPSPALSQTQALPGSRSGSVHGSPAVGHSQLQLQTQPDFFGPSENASAVSSPGPVAAAVPALSS